jgi:hypothetical protein
MAGYSGTPLDRKLGIKAGMAVAILSAPTGYTKTLQLPRGARYIRTLKGPLDLVHFFTKSRAELAAKLPALIAALQPAGALWISWPKQASQVPTDVTEDVIRAVALPLGVVDVKVCAVDETWSGLKLVRRVANRAPAIRDPRSAIR